jgi:hypothetical protein
MGWRGGVLPMVATRTAVRGMIIRCMDTRLCIHLKEVRMTTKDSGMRIRIERDERDAFVQACQSQGLIAAEVLRDFMRSFAAKHSAEQSALFQRTKGQR